MASHWRPGAVAWGTVGLYPLLAVELTSLAMRRLPRRVWHGIHLLSFVALALVTLHAFMAGADASSPVVISLAIASGTVIVTLTVLRVRSAVRTPSAGRIANPADSSPPTGPRRPATGPLRPAAGAISWRPAGAAPPPPRDPRLAPELDPPMDPAVDPLFIRGPVAPPPAPAEPVVPEHGRHEPSLPSGPIAR